MTQQPRPHPYVVPPYSAIVSPLLDPLAAPLSQRLGLTTSLEPSARAELSQKLEEKGLSAYLRFIWQQRPRSGKASAAWKPYHHGEAKPPLTAAKEGQNLPILFHKKPRQ